MKLVEQLKLFSNKDLNISMLNIWISNLLVFVFLSFCLCLCTTLNRDEKRFINKYGLMEFSKFKNRCIYIRGYSKGRNPIVFFNEINDTLNGPYVLKYDRIKKGVVNFGTQLRRVPKATDTIQIINLVEDFMQYSISYIKVDSLDNIFVGFKPNDGPSIFRPSNDWSVPPNNNRKLVKLGNGWLRLEK